MPSVITVEPFSGKPSDERIAEVLEEVLDYGKEKYQEEARFALIKSCRNREVPESTRREAESFLVRFLKKKYPIEHCAGCYCEGEFDTKQFIAQSIQALFIEKLKKVALIIEKEQALYFQRLRDRHLSDSERVLTEWGCKYVAKEQIRIYLPEFQPHYLYLKDLVEHIDDQLFDEATVLLMEGRLQVAAIIYQMLAESTNRYFPSKEKLFREMPFRFEEITPVFLAYLAEAVAMHPLPKTAYCLGKLYLRFLNYPEAYPKLIIGSDSLHGVVPRNVRRKCNETAIANFAIAAEYGYDLAISAIRRLDEESIDPDILRALSDLSSRGEIVGLSYNRPEKLKRKSAKIRKDIILERRLNALSTEQKILFGIDENTTLEARIELANPWLENGKWGNGFSFGSDKNEVLKAVVVLSAISKVKHPTASKAQKILDTWLSIRENRIWLVKQYGIEPSIPKVKESFSEQVNILLKQIQAYKDQQDFKAVEHLVYQLIDVGIELEFSKKSIHQEVMCPLFYQILIDHPGVGDKYKHELRARGAILGGKVNDRDALLCLINAASIEGRPNASYQVGRRYLPYYYYMDNKLFIYDLIEDEETAKGIEKAIYYFQKAKEEGCLLLHRELDMLSDVILATHEAARKSLEKHRNRRFLDTDKEDLLEAIHLYKLAGLAGDREATFSYLSLSLSETNDSVVQFQLANLYLTGLNTPYPKQDVPRAQELLESSAKNGYAEAAFLLAHHYSPHTSHVPKLRSSDPHAASLRFLEMANKQGRLDTQWALLNREQAFANLEKENYPAALFYLLSLTQEDDATVYFQLGDMHLKGLGMKYQNFEKAIHFYRKADEKNHFLAPFMIAQSYLEKANSSVLGTINGDFDRAFDGFKQISEKKEAKDNYYGEASYLIATVFKWKLNASEVPVYLKKAYEQGYTRAREDIFVLSEQFRQNVEKCTFKNDVELALADELLQFSADAKYLKAQHKLEALKRAGNNEVKELA
ncbi:MAG: hypothetical protein K0R08_1137 [Solimicrobium sp.]|nr:hypothetical protein [Solimicrobium sp.]